MITRRTPRLIAMAVGLTVVLGRAGQAAAATTGTQCPICSKAAAADARYGTKAGHALARGAANTVLGWTELIREPAQEVKDGGNVFVGVAKGVGQGVKRTLAGVGDVLTFWTPKVHNNYIHFSDDCPLCMGKSH